MDLSKKKNRNSKKCLDPIRGNETPIYLQGENIVPVTGGVSQPLESSMSSPGRFKFKLSASPLVKVFTVATYLLLFL